MNWPDLWTPILNAASAEPLEAELQSELSRGHRLFGLPVEVIGRSLDSDDVLVAIHDGSDRVASVHLTWSGSKESPPWPITTHHPCFETWADHVRSSAIGLPRDRLEIVRTALRKWDPIGVHPEWPDCPAKDEYDPYAPPILSMLMRGADEADLIDHLRAIRTNLMGLTGDYFPDETTARGLVHWWRTKP